MEIRKNFDDMPSFEKNWIYLSNMRPVLNSRGLFHDTTEQFVTPCEPDKNSDIELRFRTLKYNVETVNVVVNGSLCHMEKTHCDKRFDYYTATVHIGEEPVNYYFEVRSGKTTVFYTQLGAHTDLNQYYNFVIYPGFKTPEWMRGAVIYQIYTDRFFNGDTSNDVVDREYSYIGDYVNHVTNWNKYPATMGVREFYGGDLEGVMQKLDYLAGLGIQCIYFNPLFVSPSNHKYDIQDYDHIDPHFGRIVDDGGEALPEGVYDNVQASRYIKRVTSIANLEASNRLLHSSWMRHTNAG